MSNTAGFTPEVTTDRPNDDNNTQRQQDGKNEIDLSHSDDETLIVDDLGIPCKLNFNGEDRKETRRYIRRCRDRPFFGKDEYEERIHQSTELLNLSLRQKSPVIREYESAMAESH